MTYGGDAISRTNRGTGVMLILVPLVLFSAADFRISIGGQGVLTLSAYELLAYVMMFPVAWFALQAALRRPRGSQIRCATWLLAYTTWVFVSALRFRVTRVDVGVGLSAVSSAYPFQMDAKALIPATLTYLSIVFFVRTRRNLALLVTAWLIGAGVNGILGLSQYVTGGPHPVPLSSIALEKLGWTGRLEHVVVTGFYSHPNTFAQVLIPWVVVAGVLAIGVRAWGRRAWLGICAGALGVVLVGTASKGAVAWAASGIIGGTLLAKWSGTRRLWLVLGAWVGLVVVMYAGGLLLAWSEGLIAFASLGGRLGLAIAALHLWIEHPAAALFGGGLDRWPDYVLLWSPFQWIDAHNVYLNQVLLYGAVGLVLFAGFLLTVMRSVLGERPQRPLACFAFAGALFAVMGSYFFEPSFSTVTEKFQLCFVAAMAVSFANLVPGVEDPLGGAGAVGGEDADYSHRRVRE